MKLSLDEWSTFLDNIAMSHIRELIQAKSFLRNACQQDVRHLPRGPIPFLCLDATLFVLVSVFTLKETICLKL